MIQIMQKAKECIILNKNTLMRKKHPENSEAVSGEMATNGRRFNLICHK